jgi:hypothetical protein
MTNRLFILLLLVSCGYGQVEWGDSLTVTPKAGIRIIKWVLPTGKSVELTWQGGDVLVVTSKDTIGVLLKDIDSKKPDKIIHKAQSEVIVPSFEIIDVPANRLMIGAATAKDTVRWEIVPTKPDTLAIDWGNHGEYGTEILVYEYDPVTKTTIPTRKEGFREDGVVVWKRLKSEVKP